MIRTVIILLAICGMAMKAEAQKEHKIPEVTVVEKGRKSKLVNLNPKGVRFLGYRTHSPGRGELRFGVDLSLNKPTWIRGMDFDVVTNSIDTLVMKVVVYKREEYGPYTSLITWAPLVNIPKYLDKQTVNIDLSEYRIVTEGDVYVGVEVVHESTGGQVGFPIYTAGTFGRDMFGAGLQIKGTVIKRE